MNVGSDFEVYLRLGIRHILDPGAADHLLYIAALTIPWGHRQWRSLLWLVTAFTVGHSLTLALATFDLVRVPSAVVEVLIPVTILLTSLITVWRNRAQGPAVESGDGGRLWPVYAVTAGFGLIHGLGFSGFLRGLLGGEESILFPLLWFNIGLELAQLVVVAAVLLGSAAIADRLVDRRAWRLVVSGATIALAAQMILQRATPS